MRIVVLSDIHANLEAFEKVIETVRTLEPDLTVSLGDVVGYGADPGRCVDLVQDQAQVRIFGNHDMAAAGMIDSCNFNASASLSIEWTKNTLEPRHIEILSGYDHIFTYGECLFTHASPTAPLKWEYVYTMVQAAEIFEKFSEKFIFIGHTHIPAVISIDGDGDQEVAAEPVITINPGTRYLINAGSVGQPRDGLNAAGFTLLDTGEMMIHMMRVPYNVRAAQMKIRDIGMPEPLAVRLATAR